MKLTARELRKELANWSDDTETLEVIRLGCFPRSNSMRTTGVENPWTLFPPRSPSLGR
jgi:hypothetical protein